MKNISAQQKIQAVQALHRNVLYDRKSSLPLSRQVQLASDALLVSQLIELINDIESKPGESIDIDKVNVESGIQYILNLKRGDEYLRRLKSNLMQQRPDSVDTVGHIKSRTEIQIEEGGEIAINTLRLIKNWPVSKHELGAETTMPTKLFLRAVHTGIMDQLEGSYDMYSDLLERPKDIDDTRRNSLIDGG